MDYICLFKYVNRKYVIGRISLNLIWQHWLSGLQGGGPAGRRSCREEALQGGGPAGRRSYREEVLQEGGPTGRRSYRVRR